MVEMSAENPKYLDVLRTLAKLNPTFLLAGLQFTHSENNTPLLKELLTRGYGPGTVLHTLITEFPDIIQDRKTGQFQHNIFEGAGYRQVIPLLESIKRNHIHPLPPLRTGAKKKMRQSSKDWMEMSNTLFNIKNKRFYYAHSTIQNRCN